MFLYFLFFLSAFLYSMVGLGGGSMYVALLGISGVEHRFIPSTALFLNIIVTFISFFNYKHHLGFKEKKKFLIFLYTFSMTGDFIGSKIFLERKEFLLILGIFLVISSFISLLKYKIKFFAFTLHKFLILIFGFLFGLLSGLVGIGGGVFLSPLLLIAGFYVKEIAFITSLYIFLNSVSGFISHFFEGNVNFSLILPLTFSVIIGAILGSFLGSFKFKPIILERILSFIILIIGIRILWITI